MEVWHKIKINDNDAVIILKLCLLFYTLKVIFKCDLHLQVIIRNLQLAQVKIRFITFEEFWLNYLHEHLEYIT